MQKDYQSLLCFIGIFGLFIIENFYINQKYNLSGTFASFYLSNLISLFLMVNHFLLISLNSRSEEEVFVFSPLQLNFEETQSLHIYMTWAIFALILLTVLYIISIFKIYQKWKNKQNLIAEQVSIQCGMVVIKGVILIHPAGNIAQPFLYVFGFLL